MVWWCTNKIRNEYAHNYGYEFILTDYEDLISTLFAKEKFIANLDLEEMVYINKNFIYRSND